MYVSIYLSIYLSKCVCIYIYVYIYIYIWVCVSLPIDTDRKVTEQLSSRTLVYCCGRAVSNRTAPLKCKQQSVQGLGFRDPGGCVLRIQHVSVKRALEDSKSHPEYQPKIGRSGRDR